MSDLDLTEAVLQVADSRRISAACIDRPVAEAIADAVERQVRERIAHDILAEITETNDIGAIKGYQHAARIARGGAA